MVFEKIVIWYENRKLINISYHIRLATTYDKMRYNIHYIMGRIKIWAVVFHSVRFDGMKTKKGASFKLN